MIGRNDRVSSSYDSYDEAMWEDYDEPPRRSGLFVRFVRAVSGVMAGAVLVLAVVVCVARYLAGEREFPGPGTESVAAHVVAAVVVTVAQVAADNRRGVVAVGASSVVIFTGLILMITQWWG